MSEEVPFKSLKITLSEEAILKLTRLRQGGAFRSDSAAIEECIRAVDDMIRDFTSEVDMYWEKHPKETLPLEKQAEILKRCGIRLARFGRQQ